MKGWLVYDFNDIRLEELPYPRVKPCWVIVKVKIAQVSITETLLFKGIRSGPGGRLDFIKNTIRERAPVQLLGHEFCGEIVEVGDEVRDYKIGDRVSARSKLPCRKCRLCLSGEENKCRRGPAIGYEIPGCFAEYTCLPQDALVKLPFEISDNEGATMQPLSECISAVRSTNLRIGDTVAVLGQGSMGLGIMQTARVSGASYVITTDIRDENLKVSKELGADKVINAKEANPQNEILEFTKDNGVDVVFDAAGGSYRAGLSGEKTLKQALEIVKDSGKIVEISFFEEPLEEFDASTFRAKGIQYIFPALPTKADLQHAIELTSSKRINVKQTITHVLKGLEKLPDAINITFSKKKYHAINPAQIIVSND